MASVDAFAADEHGFLVRWGPAKERGEEPCQLKLCFTCVAVEPLAALLHELSLREDCYFVKLDREIGRHGMVRGRCFLTSSEAVVDVWRRHKVTDVVLTTVQDDSFINPRRP